MPGPPKSHTKPCKRLHSGLLLRPLTRRSWLISGLPVTVTIKNSNARDEIVARVSKYMRHKLSDSFRVAEIADQSQGAHFFQLLCLGLCSVTCVCRQDTVLQTVLLTLRNKNKRKSNEHQTKVHPTILPKATAEPGNPTAQIVARAFARLPPLRNKMQP